MYLFATRHIINFCSWRNHFERTKFKIIVQFFLIFTISRTSFCNITCMYTKSAAKIDVFIKQYIFLFRHLDWSRREICFLGENNICRLKEFGIITELKMFSSSCCWLTSTESLYTKTWIMIPILAIMCKQDKKH